MLPVYPLLKFKSFLFWKIVIFRPWLSNYAMLIINHIIYCYNFRWSSGSSFLFCLPWLWNAPIPKRMSFSFGSMKIKCSGNTTHIRLLMLTTLQFIWFLIAMMMLDGSKLLTNTIMETGRTSNGLLFSMFMTQWWPNWPVTKNINLLWLKWLSCTDGGRMQKRVKERAWRSWLLQDKYNL